MLGLLLLRMAHKKPCNYLMSPETITGSPLIFVVSTQSQGTRRGVLGPLMQGVAAGVLAVGQSLNGTENDHQRSILRCLAWSARTPGGCYPRVPNAHGLRAACAMPSS